MEEGFSDNTAASVAVVEVLGTRRDAGRQLIRSKKPTIAFTVGAAAVVSTYTSLERRCTFPRWCARAHPRRRVKDLVPLEMIGASGSRLALSRGDLWKALRAFAPNPPVVT